MAAASVPADDAGRAIGSPSSWVIRSEPSTAPLTRSWPARRHVDVSNTRTSSRPEVASQCPSALNASKYIPGASLASSAICAPVSAFQTCAALPIVSIAATTRADIATAE
jgi:hypothetical protein